MICLTKFRNLSENKQICDITPTDSGDLISTITGSHRHLKTGKRDPTFTLSPSGMEEDRENLLIQGNRGW